MYSIYESEQFDADPSLNCGQEAIADFNMESYTGLRPNIG